MGIRCMTMTIALLRLSSGRDSNVFSIIHNAYRIDLAGESLRKRRSSP